MSDLTGHSLGPYKILDEIGRGGMADVYSAIQPSIGRQVAIKVLPAQFLQDPIFVERFAREVQVIARLQHPHILPVYDFGEDNGRHFIVMAYMPGGTLSDRIRREGALPLDEVARLTEQIAGGLDFAHEKGIVHRDFKPSNVLLDEKGNVYLADFGIARLTESTAHLTGSGIVGTPAYMAPEMAHQGGVTPLIDVYALGVTVFEMLSGQRPYLADTPMGILMAHSNEPVPDVRISRPELPDAVQTIIERAMQKDPRQRTQSAGELASEFRAVVDAVARGDLQFSAPPPERSSLPSVPPASRPGAAESYPPVQPPADRAVWTAPPSHGASGSVYPAAAAPQSRRRRGVPLWMFIGGAIIAIGVLAGGMVLIWALWNWMASPSQGIGVDQTPAIIIVTPDEAGDVPIGETTVVPSAAPNATEYPECPGAIKPRLKVGGKGRIAPGDPSTLWFGPNKAPAVTTLYAGTPFKILEGPVCAKAMEGNLNTWHVELENGVTGWLAEGYAGGEYWLEPVAE